MLVIYKYYQKNNKYTFLKTIFLNFLDIILIFIKRLAGISLNIIIKNLLEIKNIYTYFIIIERSVLIFLMLYLYLKSWSS